jgi:hypothetical protein
MYRVYDSFLTKKVRIKYYMTELSCKIPVTVLMEI